MADDNKSISERKALLQSEYDVQQTLIAAQRTHLSLSNKGFEIQKSIVDELKSQATASDKIESVNTAIDELLKEQIERGTTINQHYIDKLDTVRKILEEHAKQDKIIRSQNKMLETRKGILNSILGIESDLEEAILNGTLKALMLQTAFDNVSANAKRMADGLKEGVTQMGLSVGQSFQLQGNIEQARFSLTGFLYGTEAVAASAKAITEEYGSAGAATSDMIKGVTQLSAITGDAASATQLAKVFEQAGVNATDVRGTIEDIAKSQGISAKKAMEGMTDQMDKLVGKSKEELQTIIASNAQLVKQGTNMKQIEDISNSMLSVETSMRAEAKARAFLGRDINASAVRTASLELKQATTDKQRADARKKISDAVLEGVGGMDSFNKLSDTQKQLLADSYGMNSADLATMMEKKKTQDELTAKYGEYADFVEGTIGASKMMASGLVDAGIEMAKLIAKTTVLNLLQGKGTGLVNPFSGGGGDITSDVTNTNQGGGDVGNASQGAGGGLKSLAEGLKEMGDGKVFAGIGAVALAGPAFIVALPSIPFLLFMGKVKLKALEENFTGLGKGLAQMPQGILGALTMAIAGPALALGMLAIPFLAFMSIPAIGPIMQANFTALAAGLAAFGNPATAVFVLIGIGLMALLGAAMIPFAYALSLLSPLVEAFGNIFIGVFAAIPPIITAVADGLVNMMNAVTMENVGAMLLLGPALFGIAAGLAAVGIMGLPGLAILTGLALIGPSLMELTSSAGGGAGSETESGKDGNTLGELLTEIKGLRQDLQAQPIVLNVDGKVVSKISRVQSRQNVSKQGYGG